MKKTLKNKIFLNTLTGKSWENIFDILSASNIIKSLIISNLPKKHLSSLEIFNTADITFMLNSITHNNSFLNTLTGKSWENIFDTTY
jgi:glutamine cyclotransferase